MSELMCSDAVFGDMSYKYNWHKKQNVALFGHTWEVSVVARAYSGKNITEEQQKSYAQFINAEDKYANEIGEALTKYVNDNLHELAINWGSARKMESIESLCQVVTPKTILFKQNGSAVVLMDCVWDIENGIGVEIIPEIKIGSQDLFL